MKLSIILFIAMSAILSLPMSAKAAMNLPSHCPQNPFLSELKTNHVKLFLKPAPYQGNSCGDEWKNHGLCCDEADLLQYVEQDHKNITKAVRRVKTSFNKLANNLVQIHKHAKKLERPQVKSLESHQKDMFKFFRSNMTQQSKFFIKKLVKEKNFQRHLNDCWSKIKTSRSNALCSVCSGRSSRFFSDKKIIMIDTDCKGILSTCATSFQLMVGILKGTAVLFNNFRNSINDTHSDLISRLTYLEKMVKIIQQEKVLKQIKKYLDESGPKKMEIGASLCSKFLNIEGKTFIEKSVRIFSQFTMGDYKDIVEQTFQDQMKAPSQPSNFPTKDNPTHSRKLFEVQTNNSLPASENIDPLQLDTLFSGDVAVVAKNVDSSYTSYFGNTGTTVSLPINSIPFNITRAFP